MLPLQAIQSLEYQEAAAQADTIERLMGFEVPCGSVFFCLW